MTWARIDDQFHAHPKIRRAWKCRPALGLHVLAMSYCAGQLTDGVVDHAFVEERLPAKRERNNVISALISAGLWRETSDGFVINDWLDYNPSREDVLAERAANAQRQAEWRARRNAVTNTASNAASNSAPTQPDLKEEKEQREERRDARRPRGRMGGPTHDDANAAGEAWAARKRELEGAE